MRPTTLFALAAGLALSTAMPHCAHGVCDEGVDDEVALLQTSHADIGKQKDAKLLAAAPAEMKPFLKPCPWSKRVMLHQSDFNEGSYFITKPGYYVLAEDIVFAPQTDRMFPPKDSARYPSRKGFFLGFFAAIIIEANDVTLDLNGHTLSSSYEFSMRQRFFALVELANLPFNPGTGPPQFAALLDPLVCAENVVIHGGSFGLTSHGAIHGNNNRNVMIHDVKIKDFETSGIHFNNGTNMHLSDATIGPSLGAPGSSHPVPALATLSQAINLLRTVEGAAWANDQVFQDLSQAVETFIAQRVAGTPPSPAVPFADPAFYDGLPDGSALYGVVLTPPGPAVGSLNDCRNGLFGELFTQNRVTTKGLHLSTQEIVMIADGRSNTARDPHVPGKKLAGPAGDVVQIQRIMDANNDYVPNVLSEAQIALGKLARDNAAMKQTNYTEYFFLFGGSYIPLEFQEWAEGSKTFDEMMAAIQGELLCGGDAMAHVNKGIMAQRTECVERMRSTHIHISDLYQQGHRAPLCGTSNAPYFANAVAPYAGNDACGVRLAGRASKEEFYHVSDVTSVNGRVIGVNVDLGRAHASLSDLCQATVENMTAVTIQDAKYFMIGQGEIVDHNFDDWKRGMKAWE